MTEIVISARDFIMAGGVLSLDAWLDLSEDDREAFKIAGREKEERMADDLIDRISATFSEVADTIRLERMVDEAVRDIEGVSP